MKPRFNGETLMKSFLTLFGIIFCANAFASEGFHTSPLPPQIKAVWDSTIVYRAGGGFCSAFLIHKEQINGRHMLFFMSAAHCIEGVDGFKDNEPTTDLKLVRETFTDIFPNVAVDLSRQDWPDHFIGAPLPAQLTPVWAFRHSKFEQSGALEDVLVIGFESDRDLPELVPVKMGASGGRKNLTDLVHYSIGFPGTVLRPVAQQNVKIADGNILQKRWASGKFLAYTDFEIKKYDYSNFVTSDADSFAGNSGGALVLESGEVVGLVSHGLDSDPVTNERDYSYSGIKNKKPYRIIAYAPPSLAAVRDKAIRMFRDFISASEKN
ncbi:MAG: serine protease [Proteobacteria bacterium]|nr:MAG: serine protease [Pseudomonadota bacterium]